VKNLKTHFNWQAKNKKKSKCLENSMPVPFQNQKFTLNSPMGIKNVKVCSGEKCRFQLKFGKKNKFYFQARTKYFIVDL
jgi:peroxiredoxin